MLARLAGEFKTDKGSNNEAELRCSYDGAALVYARAQALEHIGTADPAGCAFVLTFRTDGSAVDVFSHHAARTAGPNGVLQNHMRRVVGTYLTASYGDSLLARRRLRNAQGFARRASLELRDGLVASLDGVARLPPSAGPLLPPPVGVATPLTSGRSPGSLDGARPKRKASTSSLRTESSRKSVKGEGKGAVSDGADDVAV